jgi:hypothetical protein
MLQSCPPVFWLRPLVLLWAVPFLCFVNTTSTATDCSAAATTEPLGATRLRSHIRVTSTSSWAITTVATPSQFLSWRVAAVSGSESPTQVILVDWGLQLLGYAPNPPLLPLVYCLGNQARPGKDPEQRELVTHKKNSRRRQRGTNALRSPSPDPRAEEDCSLTPSRSLTLRW